MEDYPRNLAELERRFASDEACRDYLLEQAVNTAPVRFAKLVSVPESPPTPKPQAVEAT